MRLCPSIPIRLIIIAFSVLWLSSSCKQKVSEQYAEEGDTLSLRYAKLLHIVDYDSCTVVSIDNPWKEGSTLHRYVLVDKTQPIPSSLPTGTLLRTPIDRTVVFTTAHCQLFKWLGALDKIKGVADLKYILIEDIHKGVISGKIADCGDGMNPVIEKIIDIKPEMLMISPFENSGGYGQIEKTSIPLVECADYMEESALGRAEWMRFYGMLVGKSEEADSLFMKVDSTYHALKSQAQKSAIPRSIITEKLTGNTWYVAGGCSTVGRLISDANGTYAWSDDPHSGSLAMTFETVLDKAGQSDLWLFNYFGSGDLTYDRLASEYQGYREMKAFKQHNTWYVDTQKKPYFEEVSFHPDYLLREYIILLHPELELGQPRYYTPVR